MLALQTSSIFPGLVGLALAGRLDIPPTRIGVGFDFDTDALSLTFKSEYVQEEKSPDTLADEVLSTLSKEQVTVEFKGAVIKVCAAAPCVLTTEPTTESTPPPPSVSTATTTPAEDGTLFDAALTAGDAGGLGTDIIIVIAVVAVIVAGLGAVTLCRRNNEGKLKQKMKDLADAQDQAALEMETMPEKFDPVNSKSSLTALVETEHNTIFTETELDTFAQNMQMNGNPADAGVFDITSFYTNGAAANQGAAAATLGSSSTDEYLTVATAWSNQEDFDDFEL